MASRDGFDFRIDIDGLDDLLDELAQMPDDLSENLREGMTEYGLLLEEGARELVHYDGGDLETSLEFQGLKVNGDSLEGAVGSESKYALRRHEEPYKPGTRDKYDNGVKFVRYYLNGRGRETHKKPKWRGLPAGRKFLERAMTATEKDFDEILYEVHEKTIRGRSR